MASTGKTPQFGDFKAGLKVCVHHGSLRQPVEQHVPTGEYQAALAVFGGRRYQTLTLSLNRQGPARGPALRNRSTSSPHNYSSVSTSDARGRCQEQQYSWSVVCKLLPIGHWLVVSVSAAQNFDSTNATWLSCHRRSRPCRKRAIHQELCAKAGDRQRHHCPSQETRQSASLAESERDKMKHRASVAASSRPAAYPRAIRLSRLLASAIV